MPSLSPWQFSTRMMASAEHGSDSARGRGVRPDESGWERPLPKYLPRDCVRLRPWLMALAMSPPPQHMGRDSPGPTQHLEQPLTRQEVSGSGASLWQFCCFLSLGRCSTYLTLLCLSFLMDKMGILPTSLLGGWENEMR